MASSPKEKFDAAVKVIRGLPKNGSFQPSHELMLKFYGYFKQATEGPCTTTKPGFWDLVNRKKWEAWSNLGQMDREEAMLLYVDELKKVSNHVRETYYPPQIVETMPQTEAVTEFLQKLDNFYEMVEDSENHNTLKMIDKPKQNGSVPVNGTPQNGHDLDKSQVFDHSYNVTQLLKQDVKWWQDRPGVVKENSGTHGSADEQNPHFRADVRTNGNHKLEEEEERNEYDDDEDDEDDDDEEDDRDKQGTGSNEEWEEVNEVKVSTSHSESANDSETENEEFCDTSDEPIELPTLESLHSQNKRLPPLTESSSTSTPMDGGRNVHFEPDASSSDLQISESHFVSEKVTQSLLGQAPVGATVFDGSRSDSLDISMCRGGEEQERDRRRRAGGQGSREYSSSGSRGAQGSSGGDGGGNDAGGGRRGLFPGPGGGGGNRGAGSGRDMSPTDLNEQIVVTLLRLQHDMSGVLNRLNSLEALVKEGKMERERRTKAAKSWWPFPDLSMKSALVILVWPLIVHVVITYISRRRRKLGR